MVWWGGVVHGVVGCLWELVSVFWKSLVTGARVMCFGCLDILVFGVLSLQIANIYLLLLASVTVI